MDAMVEYRVDWPALDKAFTAYLQRPGPSTAQGVAKILPPGIADRHIAVFDSDTVGRIYSKLDKVEQLVKRGRRDALDVAFALISISDAHFTEDLLAMIPKSLDANPTAFLSALKANASRPFADCDLALDVGLEYEEHPYAELAVLHRRIEQVEKVADPALASEKDCVLKSLRKAVGNFTP
jgi:hypothetical protein